MKLELLTILSFIIFSCDSQNKEKKKQTTQKKIERTTETFDIETFDKNKIIDEYNFVLENGTKIRQTSSSDSYSEYITHPKPELFIEFKGYYKNGKLKRYVIRYPNNFQKIRKEYNKDGKLIEEINYDTPFKFTFEELLELLKKEKETIDIFNKNTSIARGINGVDWQGKIDTNYTWYIEWKKTYGRRETLKVHGVTGEILERGHYPMEDN